MILRNFAVRLSVPKCSTSTINSSSRTFSYRAPHLFPAKPRRPIQPKAKVPPPKPSRNSSIPTELKFMGRWSKSLEQLTAEVIKNGKVVLFEAPSQRSYIWSAYGISAVAFAWVVNVSTLNFGNDNPAWQKPLFNGVCIAVSMMAAVVIGRTSRLIKTITAVGSKGQVNIEIKVRSMVPFRKPYTITSTPRQINFARQLPVDPRRVTSDGQLQPITMQVSFFKSPLKAVSYLFFKIFLSIRRVFTQEDFALVEMQGKRGTYRIDSNGSISKLLWALGNTPMETQK
ncbi:hypothetical protein BGW36DRAFT_346099 [Talaromyces proteolyticus]|uniref:Uncharacterized protein n=1 Tax=Talaromyces proteolyticus TaxID=1131652 RepID=A0AAD4KN75_9EURO|nr:uncharacterized protein BGW36DRAFT_346099 [Talaromyces proteolyticus]KAH8694130.1 hypothetical protein BGW36DRAFT_346099 [Talaromyces proteolyticus]